MPTPLLGRWGEDEAARFLHRRGFRILARNLRLRLGEVDLIAWDGTTLVFVEVKTRRPGAPEPPQGAVDARKQARLGRLARGYLARIRASAVRCRFDVVAVTGEPGGRARVEHLPAAFTVEGW